MSFSENRCTLFRIVRLKSPGTTMSRLDATFMCIPIKRHASVNCPQHAAP